MDHQPLPGEEPSAAGVWNQWLGGRDYHLADKQAAEEIRAAYPRITHYARNSRAWLLRAVRAAAQDGLDQFLDVGAGLPDVDHATHEVAAQHAPTAPRTLYIDIDPRVLRHQEAEASRLGGRVAAAHADMRQTATVLAAAHAHLDLTRPVCVIFSDCLGHLHDLDEALGTVQRLCAQLPDGSYLALSHSTRSSPTPHRHVRYTPRTPQTIAGFFDGLTLLSPGLVSVQDWRPDATTPRDPDLHDATYAALARITHP